MAYNFECGVRGPGTCITGKLTPGLIVVAGPEEKDWTCISGGDSTFGWVRTSQLAPVPDNPHIQLSQWIGWWHRDKEMPGVKNDRLLITRGKSPGTLHISGRAYWYGIAGNVHFGEVKGDATPVGPYLHVVEGDDLSGCVLDLEDHPMTQHMSAYDNARWGGMNVRFLRTWTRFNPSERRAVSRDGLQAR